MPSTAIRVDTIRDLILDRYEISIHCRAYPCANRIKADLAAVARKHGLDWRWFGKRWPYRCDRRGGRDVGIQLLPGVRPNSTPDGGAILRPHERSSRRSRRRKPRGREIAISTAAIFYRYLMRAVDNYYCVVLFVQLIPGLRLFS
jgi:hypothetical protein